VIGALTIALALGAATARSGRRPHRGGQLGSDPARSAPAKAAQTKLEAEFAKRDKDLQDMAARLKSMSDRWTRTVRRCRRPIARRSSAICAQLDTDFQRKQREFREDLNQRRNEELAAVLERANKVIKQIAEQQQVRPDRAGSRVRQPAHRHHRQGAQGARVRLDELNGADDEWR
jgi:outer membrane protein